MVCFIQFRVLPSNLNMFTAHRPDIIQDRELNEDIPAFPASISASYLIILNLHEMNTGPIIHRLPSGCILFPLMSRMLD